MLLRVSRKSAGTGVARVARSCFDKAWQRLPQVGQRNVDDAVLDLLALVVEVDSQRCVVYMLIRVASAGVAEHWVVSSIGGGPSQPTTHISFPDIRFVLFVYACRLVLATGPHGSAKLYMQRGTSGRIVT